MRCVNSILCQTLLRKSPRGKVLWKLPVLFQILIWQYAHARITDIYTHTHRRRLAKHSWAECRGRHKKVSCKFFFRGGRVVQKRHRQQHDEQGSADLIIHRLFVSLDRSRMDVGIDLGGHMAHTHRERKLRAELGTCGIFWVLFLKVYLFLKNLLFPLTYFWASSF